MLVGLAGLVLVSLALVVLGGCGGESPSLPTPPLATPSPDSRLVVVPGAPTGPTAIAFVSAEPSPGAVLTGWTAARDGVALSCTVSNVPRAKR
jgi:hypothetical protein